MIMRILVGAALIASVLSTVDDANPVTKVVGLLNEMKTQVEKEAAEDKELYDEMACWCTTNDKEKTAAVEIAQKTITDLTAKIETYVARKATLATEIESLGDENAANTDALAQATAMREKEAAEFAEEEATSKQASAALKQAIEVLAKVQLSQMPPKPEVLLQLNGIEKVIKIATQRFKFKDVMQEDLWNLLSDLGGASRGTFLPGSRTITGLQQEEPEAIEGGGGVAGAKSYNSRSGQIVGMLTTMKHEFDTDLAASQKEELQSQIAYQSLRAAKEAQIAAANGAIEEKSRELADTGAKLAQAKQDLEDTQNALSADQKFLIDLEKRCKIADEEYTERAKTRQDEIVAIGETIKILTSDESRDLFSKTMSLKQSFVQVGLVQRHAQVQSEEARGKQRHAAAGKILALAKRTHNWMLAGLAVSVQLDAFTKIKEIMDKMVAELKKQQEEEVKKNEACKTDIDTNEDETLAKKHEVEDLESTISDLEGTLATLKEGLDSAKQQVADSQVSLKRSGEDRKAANLEFQQVVADQRATVNILNKALARLKSFYAKKEALLQLKRKRQEPGAAAPPPPPSGKAYEKSGGAGGVMQMIAKIIEDAEKAATEAVTAEQDNQQAYAEMVANTNAALEALSTEITEKTIAEAEARGSKEVAEKDLMAAQAEKTGLEETGIALHKECDYLLKNFKVRQTARQEEIEAIQEAKAILSGSDFGL